MPRNTTPFKKLLPLMLILFTLLAAPAPVWAQDDTPDTPPQTQDADAAEDTSEVPATDAESADTEPDFQAKFNDAFNEHINRHLGNILFFPILTVGLNVETGEHEYFEVFGIGGPKAEDIPEGVTPVGMPLIVFVLVIGGIFFTVRFGFINIRLFRHAIHVVRGRFDKPGDEGEVNHFQALTSALSATVGLGNIAGVAIAITMGGPGAVFWMWVTAFFGMSLKFSCCTLAHVYRRVGPDGRVQGGPMVYLEEGIREVVPSLAPLGKLFAVFYAVLMILAAFGAGNMFQANQTASIVSLLVFDGNESNALKIGMGVVMAFLTGIVIIGGIKRIGEITAKMVPLMCLFYCTVCLIIVLMNVSHVPSMFGEIFSNAFTPDAAFGGFVGVLVQGMRRAAFSNEAGLGSAAIAHAAAKTNEPVREGVVAMLEPFIDTIVVCTGTALAILITGAHEHAGELVGVQITAKAFAQLGGAVPFVLCLAVFVFAYSTLITWGYYAERCVEYLFGEKAIMLFRLVYIFVIIIAPIMQLSAILDFADILLLTLAFPNIIGMAIISVKLKPMVEDYYHRLATGQMKPVK